MGLGSEIRYPEKTYSGSLSQKRHRIPDPDPQHCMCIVRHLLVVKPLLLVFQSTRCTAQ
jgi:hypothetical protein